MFCSKCGVKAVEGQSNCASCGNYFPNNQAPTLLQPNSQMSIIAIVLAIVFPIAGIFVSKLAQKEISNSGGALGGGALASLAFKLSLIFSVLQAIAVIYWVGAYLEAMSAYNEANQELEDLFSDLEEY